MERANQLKTPNCATISIDYSSLDPKNNYETDVSKSKEKSKHHKNEKKQKKFSKHKIKKLKDYFYNELGVEISNSKKNGQNQNNKENCNLVWFDFTFLNSKWEEELDSKKYFNEKSVGKFEIQLLFGSRIPRV